MSGKTLEPIELDKARKLIFIDPLYTGEYCWVCECNGFNDQAKSFSIFGLGMCKHHAIEMITMENPRNLGVRNEFNAS